MKALRKIRAALWLLASYMFDLVVSTLTVARIVLAPGIRTQPAIVAMPVRLNSRWAVALLAYCTSLTPGSTCLHVSENRKHLFLHLLDTRDPDAAVAKFHRQYQRPIMELEG